MLAGDQATQINMQQISNSLDISGKSVARYLDLLVDLLMVRKLPAYTFNTNKRLIKSPKIYIRDHGIALALLAISNNDQLLSYSKLGNIILASLCLILQPSSFLENIS